MKITIKTISNGATVTYETADAESLPDELAYIFADEDLTGLESMLWDLVELLSLSNKRSKERISISRIHGYEYECKDPKCVICEQKKEKS